jgi:hypothetical protein
MRLKQPKPSHAVKLSDASLSDWFRGKTVPLDDRRFHTLVALLTNSPLDAALKRLHRDAWQESARRRGSRQAADPAPRRHSVRWLPRLTEVHYANLERVAELVLSRSETGRLPPVPESGYAGLGFVEPRQALLRALADLNLPAKRFTRDFNLRALVNSRTDSHPTSAGCGRVPCMSL